MLAMQVFGRTFSLAGYPPWSIRFSEIYHMGELTDFTRRKLTDALQRYCKTPQRFGT
jgi:undecaprenyl pyrophosphate synthase